MAKNKKNKEKDKTKPTVGDLINDFLQKNRKVFLGLLCLIIITMIGLIAAVIIREKLLEKAWSRVEELSLRYEALKDNGEVGVEIDTDIVDSEIGVDSEIDTEADEVDGEVDDENPKSVLLEDLLEFAEKNSGFPAARSYSMAARLYEDEKDWSKAEELWVKAAKTSGKNYFNPISYFNAAIAAEEQENFSAALDYYKDVLKSANLFPIASRVQFSIGRLEETLGDADSAIKSYNTLIDEYQDDTFWVNLAQNRLIVLLADPNIE